MILKDATKADLASVLGDAAVAFGVFDGIHLGHRYIVGEMLNMAREQGKKSSIVTFSVDPDEMFRPEKLKKLMTNERRIEMLDALGADTVVVLSFTREFAAMPPDEFIEQVFAPGVPSSLHVGHDLRFGCRAAGTVDTLAQWGKQAGMKVLPYELFEHDGEVVTATAIRGHLAQCQIDRANELLGRPFWIEGTVETGRGEGRDMGFRTANISVPAWVYSLGEGVYGGYGITEAGERYKAAISVGGAPTFGEEAKANLEVHLLDFDQDIYGQTLRVEFVSFLRPMIVFDSVDELIATVMGNIQWVHDNL